jgi:hypothetical protein
MIHFYVQNEETGKSLKIFTVLQRTKIQNFIGFGKNADTASEWKSGQLYTVQTLVCDTVVKFLE